ncbi:hypothetical protein R3P38DRAFT_758892 [Favolaschia claudopus]|uniref:Uncharacterized protein n=1 Tax=Favolaschia claudopus TaxID=2862362 RepID=A0AAV9Z363_9AGAR
MKTARRTTRRQSTSILAVSDCGCRLRKSSGLQGKRSTAHLPMRLRPPQFESDPLPSIFIIRNPEAAPPERQSRIHESLPPVCLLSPPNRLYYMCHLFRLRIHAGSWERSGVDLAVPDHDCHSRTSSRALAAGSANSPVLQVMPTHTHALQPSRSSASCPLGSASPKPTSRSRIIIAVCVLFPESRRLISSASARMPAAGSAVQSDALTRTSYDASNPSTGSRCGVRGRRGTCGSHGVNGRRIDWLLYSLARKK